MNNIIDGIYLETYNIPILYTMGMQQIKCALKPFHSYNILDNKLIVISKLLGTKYEFQIIFFFLLDRIASISITPLCIEGQSRTVFKVVQAELVALLGLPSNFLEIFLNSFNSDNKRFVWKNGRTTVIHKFTDHFGYNEEIEIKRIDVL